MIRLMMTLTFAAALILSAPGSRALETYSETQTQEFMDWCTGAKSASESVCSCTLKRLAQTVPVAALAQFLNSQGQLSFSSAAVTTAATVTEAMVTCNQ